MASPDADFYTTAPLTPAERGTIGALTRLLTEDPAEMTRAARESANHVSNLERWTRKAQEANPRLTHKQAVRVGEMMRREHYRRMGQLSAQARRLAREAQAELDRADGMA